VELHPEIKMAFSRITDLLEDGSNYVRGVAIQAVIDLVARSKRYNREVNRAKEQNITGGLENELKAAFPKIIKLLSDEWDGIRGAAIKAVNSFAKQGKEYMHHRGIVLIISEAELQTEIGLAVPMVTKLLGDGAWDVAIHALPAIETFSTHG
jgi:hypothetical protein